MLSKTTSSGETAFPWKLHMVLEESFYAGFEDVISWIGHNAFKVHDPIQFEETIMRRYFNQTQYKSFQRQRKYNSACDLMNWTIVPDQNISSSFFFPRTVNIYGFVRVKTAGKATGSYTHPLFIRGNPDACAYMVRIKVKKKGIRKLDGKEVEKVQSSRPLPAECKSSEQQKEKVPSRPHHDYKMPETKHCFDPKIVRSVSPSFQMAQRNSFIEPTPIDSLSSSNNSSVSKSTVVTCDRSNYTCLDASNSSQQSSVRPLIYSMDDSSRSRVTPMVQKIDGRFFEKLRPTYYNNVDLDLDTVFDDDNNIHNSIMNSNKYKRNAGDYSCYPSEGYLSMNNKNGVFDSNFQTVQNSLSDLIDKQQSIRTTATASRPFYY